MKLMSIVCVGLVAGVVAGADRAPDPPDPLNGAWRLVEMRVVAPDGKSVAVPVHESLVIFADGYYSIGYAFGEDGSVPYAERWRASDREKIARFGSVIVNAGSYQLSGSELDARPLFALAPEFVGGKGVFSYTFAGETLELTWKSSIAFDGLEYPSRGTVTLLRLVRIR